MLRFAMLAAALASPLLGEPRAVVLSARDAYLRPRCMEAADRALTAGDLVRGEGPDCERQAVTRDDTLEVRKGGSVELAVCEGAVGERVKLGEGFHRASAIGRGDELTASEAAFCSTWSVEDVLDAGVQHIRELVVQTVAECARTPDCGPEEGLTGDAAKLRPRCAPDSCNEMQLLGWASQAEKFAREAGYSAGAICESLRAWEKLKGKWPQAGWIVHKLTQLRFFRTVALLAARPDQRGTTGLAVGISGYLDGQQKLLPARSLIQPADNATAFYRYLEAIGAAPVLLKRALGDESRDGKASAARIVTELARMLCRSGDGSSAIFFVSSHGQQDSKGNSFVVPEDGFSGNLRITGVSDRQIRDLLTPFSSHHVFLDACREPKAIAPRFEGLDSYLKGMPRPKTKMADLLVYSATKGDTAESDIAESKKRCQNAPSLLECGSVANGYGEFTYRLVNFLANRTDRGGLTGRMLRFEFDKWPAGKRPDSPTLSIEQEFPTLKPAPRKTGFSAPPFSPWVSFFMPPAQGTPAPVEDPTVAAVRAAILDSAEESRIRPLILAAGPNRRDEVRILLEEAGQRVIRHYLEGDNVEPQRKQFEAGARWFRLAGSILPGSAAYQSRALFCEARAEMFDLRGLRTQEERQGRLDGIMAKLWPAQRLDPEAAYTLNALGIAHLESGLYDDARRFLADAVHRQPGWAYPRHNLALALMQQGRSRDAVDSYLAAIREAPNYAYPHHNLALLYQRLNRRREAHEEYRRTDKQLTALASREPNRVAEWNLQTARLLNAWGTLYAQERRSGAARRRYLRARAVLPPGAKAGSDAGDIAHNLALLEKDPKRRAGELHKVVASFPTNLASRLELARLAQGEAAVEQYRAVLIESPRHIAAQVELGERLIELGRLDEAERESEKAVRVEPADWRALFLRARLARALGREAEAAKVYREAADAATNNRGALKRMARIWNSKSPQSRP